jgi:uncharacterized protein YjeT (DUF2065 family)
LANRSRPAKSGGRCKQMRLLKFFYPREWEKVDEQAREKAPGFLTIVGLVLSLVAFLVAMWAISAGD